MKLLPDGPAYRRNGVNALADEGFDASVALLDESARDPRETVCASVRSQLQGTAPDGSGVDESRRRGALPGFGQNA